MSIHFHCVNSFFIPLHSCFSGEKRIGPRRFKADGYCPDSNTVFQFDGESHFFINQLYAITSTELTFFYHLGCFYHGCKCLIGKTKLPDEMTAAQRKKIAAKRKKIAAKKRNKDKIRNAYTRRQGYNLVIKKECEWREVKIAVSDLLNVCVKTFP